jgi:hypothetical protein
LLSRISRFNDRNYQHLRIIYIIKWVEARAAVLVLAPMAEPGPITAALAVEVAAVGTILHPPTTARINKLPTPTTTTTTITMTITTHPGTNPTAANRTTTPPGAARSVAFSGSSGCLG